MKFLPYFLLFVSAIVAQTQYPKDYFRSPLDIPIELSGCFGELRNNHFHSGFDIRTQQTEGLPVFAVADGYISRIKISLVGYGKVIYITHPNGFTSVYGHLQRGNGEIQKYIKDFQYKEKAYEVEMFPKPNELVITKGQQIAFSGNTGGSGGPHLHFEFRETVSEKILNPMLFGFNKYIKDTKKPSITGLFAYPMDDKSIVNENSSPVSLNLTLQSYGSYMSEKLKLSGNAGFGINVYDMFDNSYTKYGIYKVELFNNGKSTYSYQFDVLAFEELRYINAFIDYGRYQTMDQRVQKLFMKNPFPLSIINPGEKNGIISMNNPNLSEIYRIEISDFENNKTCITIPVEYSNLPSKNLPKPFKTNYFVKSKSDFIYNKDNVEVFFPAGSFYEDFYMDCESSKNEFKVKNYKIPVHSNYTITMKDSLHTELELKQMFLAKIEGKKQSYVYTNRKGFVFTSKTKELGKFALSKDSVAPRIVMMDSIVDKFPFEKKYFQLKISDDLSGIKTYNGFLNDQWILLEYESKNKKLTHYFEDNIAIEGDNKLKVIVSDNVGNSTIFETIINRNTKQ
jgi:murein DD-endopeptidase MepM/ murein hydrolase activator NlpD